MAQARRKWTVVALQDFGGVESYDGPVGVIRKPRIRERLPNRQPELKDNTKDNTPGLRSAIL